MVKEEQTLYQEQKMVEETLKKGIKFDIKSYRELWQIMDMEDRAKLLFICQLPYIQRKSITLLDNAGYTSKEVLTILNINDHRQFERIRSKALKRILNILNSSKHNDYYSSLLNNK